MGQITRLLTDTDNNVQSSETEEVVNQLIGIYGTQTNVNYIKEVTIINSGNTLRFTYTDNTISDLDLPEGVKAASIQKNGDIDILTIKGLSGNTQIFNIVGSRNINVVSGDDNVLVEREEDSTTKDVTFRISVDEPTIPEVNDGTITLRQGDITLGTFTTNQKANKIIDIPAASGEDGQQGEKGDTGMSAYDLWLEEGNIGTVDDFLNSLKGANGEKGETGEQGEKGDKGDKGEPFTIAKTYSSVEEMQDDLPYMEVNDYVMIASSVEQEDNAKLYVKTDNGWIFITDFSGATGIKGDKGDTGEKGEDGQDGANGQDGQNGKSAYQIAVDNGFVGTESEWLASLKGEKGDKGDSGDTLITDVKVNNTSVVTNKIANIQVTDNNATLAYGQTSNIAEINNVPIRVTLPEKPEYEGIDIEFYDITAKSELDFFKAVAISRGYPVNRTNEITAITNDNKYYVTTGYAVDGVITPVQVRVHFASDITLTNCFEYNLSTVTVNGNDYSLNYSSPLTFKGRSCKFNNTKFAVAGDLKNKYLITFDGDSGEHNKYTFDKCQFNGSVKQSSGRSNDFINVSRTNGSTSCTIYFYFCIWVTNSGSGDNSTLVSGGKITINFESPIGSPNLKILSNLGTGVTGSHSCTYFDVTSLASVSGEFIYDSSSSLTENDDKVISRNIFAS